MKVYTFFTDSHKQFLPIFINSFPFEDGLDLEIKYLPQECTDGKYYADGWKNTMKRKVEYIVYSLEHTSDNDFFLHSDIDIQFFGRIKNDLFNIIISSDKDILFQDDGLQVCMGFFICKKNDKTINLFNKLLSSLDNYPDDQYAMNEILKTFDVSYGRLPKRYYSVGVKHGVWNGNTTHFEIPNDILVHHANFTIGVQNKLNLLDIIKTKVFNS